MKNSPLSMVENKKSAKEVLAETQCSLQRIKVAFKVIAKRKTSNRRIRELWYTGSVR